MNNYCVYKITNTINKKVYIGLTNNKERRWRSNGIEYKPKNGKQRLFWNAIKKYGWEVFKKEILIDNLSQTEAEQLEKNYIEDYGSRDKEKGYNIAEGGNGGRIYKIHPKGMLGKKQTPKGIEASRKNITLANKLKKNTQWKNGHPKGMLGKKHSEEYITRLKNRPTSEHPSSIKIIIVFPTGVVKSFTSMKEVVQDTGLTMHFIRNRLKETIPYKVSPKVLGERKTFLEKFEGIIIRKSENTEITN